MKLAIRIKQQADGTYLARCPSLPWCTVRGQTKQEARARIELAARSYLGSSEVCMPWELNRAPEMKTA